MQDNERTEHLSPAHRELEDALRGLSPASVNISRDRLMFQAGTMIGRRSANRWRGATALLVLVNVGLVGLVGLSMRSPHEAGQHPIAQAPAPADPKIESRETAVELPETLKTSSRNVSLTSSAKSTEAYVSLRDDVLRRGLAALPASRTPSRSEKPIAVEQLLGTSPRTPEPPSPWAPFAAPLRSFLFSGENL